MWLEPRLAVPQECLSRYSNETYLFVNKDLAERMWAPPIQLDKLLSLEERKSYRFGKTISNIYSRNLFKNNENKSLGLPWST